MREARTFLERLLLAAALPRGEMAGSVGMVCLSWSARAVCQQILLPSVLKLSRLLQVYSATAAFLFR
jgi:hypothetical protein